MRKRKLGIKGTINAFVALLMVPTIAFTGLMVDFARMNMASVEVNNAADLAATSAIAYYDGLLHDVYGLYATSQDKKKIQEFCEAYVLASLGLDKKGAQSTKSFNLFSSAKSTNPLTVTMTTDEPKYTLKNTSYFKYEVEQYMKYRMAFSFMDIVDNATDMVSGLSNAAQDKTTAENERKFVEEDYRDICEDMTEIQAKYEQLYKDIEEAETKYASFNADTQAALKDIKDIYDQLDEEIQNGIYINTNVLYDEAAEKAEQIQKDIDEYKALLASISEQAADIDAKTEALKQKVAVAQQKLEAGKGTTYSDIFVGSHATEPPNDKEAIFAQLERDLKENLVFNLATPAQQFENANTGQFDEVTYGDNTIKAGSGATVYNDVYKNASNGGYAGAGDDFNLLLVSSYPTVNINITPFNSAKKSELAEIINRTTPYDFDQSRVDNYISSDGGSDSQLNNIAERVPDGAPDLPKLKIPVGYSGWSGSFINEGAADHWLEDLSINRILLTEYGVQMFTNYTTNRRWKDGKQIKDEQTLSGVPLTPKMNYLYGAEMEYLFAGGDSATGNYTAVIATLSSIFFARNLVFTFQDDIIKNEIRSIRAIPVVGWALAEAYRFAIVIAETILDIVTLIEGKCIPLIKSKGLNKAQWRCSLMYTPNYLFGRSAWGFPESNKEGPGMYYYEYLRLLILLNFFTAGTKDITYRLATLIELNMNNYMYGNGGCANKQLTAIDKFKLKQASVLADAKVSGSVPYFFIPMPLLSSAGKGLGNGYSFEIIKTRGY